MAAYSPVKNFCSNNTFDKSIINNKIMSRSPDIVGHRGHYKTLENSLIGFKKCIDLNLSMIELDIWLTKDKIPVVIHTNEETNCISETAFGHGKVNSFNLIDIKKINLLGDYSEEKIPTLEEVLDLCDGKIKVNIEFKEKENKKEIIDAVLNIIKTKYIKEDNVLFSSFMHEYFDILRSRNKNIEFKFIAETEEEIKSIIIKNSDIVKSKISIKNCSSDMSLDTNYSNSTSSFYSDKSNNIEKNLSTNELADDLEIKHSKTSVCIASNLINENIVKYFNSNNQKVSTFLTPNPEVDKEIVKNLINYGVQELIVNDPLKTKNIIESLLI